METKPSTLELFATPIASDNTFIKASFGGFAGSGKTRTATEFIIGCVKKMGLKTPVLIIDNEKGSRFLIPIFEQAGVKALVKETTHLADIKRAFDILNSGEISFLFIDSLTKVWYQFINDYKSANNKRTMTLQDWGKVIPDWQVQFSDKFVQLNGNCVFTGRGGYTYDMEENDETKKKEFVRSGVKMKLAGETPFEPDLNVWMELQQDIDKDGTLHIWREAQVMKDRSGKIDGKTFNNPTFKQFEPVIDFILSTPQGKVAKESDTTNLAPTEDYSYQNNRIQREIEMEKIKAEFDRVGFGTTKEDKQLKTIIYEKIFGTTSMTEFEKKPIEQLTSCRQNLELLFTDWNLLNDYAEKEKHVNRFEVNFLNQ